MAGTEDMGKFIEMLTKAMATMAEKTRDDESRKAERKVFDKDFIKDAREFSGAQTDYNEWAFKWRIQMKTSCEKFAEIIGMVEKLHEKFDLGILAGYDDSQGYYLSRWTTELYEVLAKKLTGEHCSR